MTGITSPGGTTEDRSLDPRAGGSYRDKPIWDLPTIEANLNRTGYDWYTNNYGELDDGVLNYGFWKNYEELANSYYVNATGSIAFNEAYYADDFSVFNAGQIEAATRAISLWDDLIDISFRETKSGNGDLNYGNTFTGGAQAYAYLPFGDVNDAFYSANYDFDEVGRLGGDVWIDGFVASNFFPLTNSFYATTTLIHETGHAIGLSHPGNYNATDDNDGDGVPDPITYENDAFFAQDSLQYSIMSYFDGYETGAQYIDFELLNFAYPSTPMIHDIAAIQEIYGADMTTRTGDTVYGFNSTADRAAYDFTLNTRPVLSIWDAGGNDTLDFSGYKTRSVIDLNEGGFSSAGGADRFYTLEEVNEFRAAAGFAPRTQATYDFYEDLKAQLGITSPLFKDNISIAYGAEIENAIGGAGNDKIIANSLANLIDGGGGTDTISYETATSGVTVSLRADATLGGGATGDQLSRIEGVIGSDFADRLNGNGRANVLNGGEGDDILRGGAGADTFVFRNAGSVGNDTIKDFGSTDMIVVNVQLTDSNSPNKITIGAGGVVALDGNDGDSVTLNGYSAGDQLVYVGTANGLFYYVAEDNTTTTQRTIDKLAAPAEALADAAVVKPHGPIVQDLSQQIEGYTDPSTAAARPHTPNSAFGGHLDGQALFGEDASAAFHGTITASHLESMLPQVHLV